MLRSHYIPQFILRAFCEDDKIQYMDLSSKVVEPRNTRSVFSVDGYYPEQLEHDLNDKIEKVFAPVHKRILASTGKLTLSAAEMFLLKKFLLVAVLRYNAKDVLGELLFAGMSESERDSIFGKFFENIERILECKNKQELTNFYQFGFDNSNLTLTAYAKDILGSYQIFVSSKDYGREFLLPDKGNAWYMGRLAMEEASIIGEMAGKYHDEFFLQTLSMMTPHDYVVFPLSKNIATICMSPFYKFAADNPHFTVEKSWVQEALGFGNGYMLKQARVSFDRDKKPIDYGFDIKALCGRDVEFLNKLLLQNAEHHIAFANKGKLGIEI